MSDPKDYPTMLGWWITLKDLRGWLEEATLPKELACNSWVSSNECGDRVFCPVSLCAKQTLSNDQQFNFTKTMGIRLEYNIVKYVVESSAIYPIPEHLQEFIFRYDDRCATVNREGDRINYTLIPSDIGKELAIDAINSIEGE